MKSIIKKTYVLILTLSILLGLTACDDKAIANLEKVAIEAEKAEAIEVEATETEAELEAETEGKAETKTKATVKVADKNANLKAMKARRAEAEKKKAEREKKAFADKEKIAARKARNKRMHGKSLGKLYPKYTLTWNGITLSYLPIPDELNPESDKWITDPDEISKTSQGYINSGYIVEKTSSFRRNDEKSTFWGAHNHNPGFKPFIGIGIGDDIYVTGYKGTTFHYKVVDILDWYHWGSYMYGKDTYYEATTENLAKIRGVKEITLIDEFEPIGVESIFLSWCRDDIAMRYVFAIPIEHYELYVEEGLIEPIN